MIYPHINPAHRRPIRNLPGIVELAHYKSKSFSYLTYYRRGIMAQNLLLASTNVGKLKELRELTADLPVNWLSLADVGLAGMDVEETGATFEDNALLKARAYSVASKLPTLADDSGLIVDALNGAPGVYSARYAPTVEERNAKLLRAVEGVAHDQRSACFVSVLAFL